MFKRQTKKTLKENARKQENEEFFTKTLQNILTIGKIKVSI